MKTRTLMLAAMAAGAGYVAFRRLREQQAMHFAGKVVLITGGSRGLGLATAREFGAHGAIVAICARDGAELDRAHADLTARGIRAHTFVCDVANRDQVEAMVTEIGKLLGPINVLVNNAGVIKVGPFAKMDVEDFDQAMDVIFWGMLYSTMAVVPGMRRLKRGSIVNITSIGGKISVPHLLPYSCAKFAAVALSDGLRTELAPAGIRVTTIAPGLMRTGSHLNAEFKGHQGDEYAWFAAGAATPLVSISAARAARAIVQATLRGDSQRVLSIPADLLARFHAIFPGLTSELLNASNRMLPSEKGGSKEVRSGQELEAGLNSRFWKVATFLGRRAAESLNEIPARTTDLVHSNPVGHKRALA